jgi:hypothetical protein
MSRHWILRMPAMKLCWPTHECVFVAARVSWVSSPKVRLNSHASACMEDALFRGLSDQALFHLMEGSASDAKH